ncbi:MAG: DUF4390 domain-containing protein [Deltaproteobacteria bacterium]|nr:MAG: DUF4390 domain-containing protein [Deltaproteobacteria bacterium]TMQ27096.1 MAG: DUF4390 domain-containing protein [Deltaproteobacteria bacterium]
MTRTLLGAAATVAAVLAFARPAHADDKLDVQRMRFVERGEELTVSTLPPGGIGKLFDATAYEALSSGIASTVVIRIQITARDANEPVAEQLIQRSVVYDVWDEIYTLRLDEPGGSRTFKVKYRAEALKWLTAIDDLPVARTQVLPLEQVFVLKMVVELNPVSRETLAEVRRWLSQGTGGGIDRGGAFFGSFVSVFYNPKIADADRVLRLRSQPFYRPTP